MQQYQMLHPRKYEPIGHVREAPSCLRPVPSVFFSSDISICPDRRFDDAEHDLLNSRAVAENPGCPDGYRPSFDESRLHLSREPCLNNGCRSYASKRLSSKLL